MGQEFAQAREWNHDASLDWHLLGEPRHAGVRRLVRDLNRLYRTTPALHELDCEGEGFEWIEADAVEESLYAWLRRGRGDAAPVLVVCNFTPVERAPRRIGVPAPGRWIECINTDAAEYGGGGRGNLGWRAERSPSNATGGRIRSRSACRRFRRSSSSWSVDAIRPAKHESQMASSRCRHHRHSRPARTRLRRRDIGPIRRSGSKEASATNRALSRSLASVFSFVLRRRVTVDAPAMHQSSPELVRGYIEEYREVDEGAGGAPTLVVEQQVVPLGDHDAVMRFDNGRGGPRELEVPIEHGNGDRPAGWRGEPPEHRCEALGVEGKGRTLSAPMSAGAQDPVVVVEAVEGSERSNPGCLTRRRPRVEGITKRPPRASTFRKQAAPRCLR